MSAAIKRLSPEFFAAALVAVALFLAVTFDGWRLSRPARDSAYIPREAVITPEIELLREYLRFDTSNPPGGELEAARWLASKLEEAGVDSELIEAEPGRANLYARLPGRTRGEGLLLTHHIDVVPADPEEWTEPPFDANIRMNQLYGRGTLDMKSTGICHLVAFTALAKSGQMPERDVVFLAVADEETGGELGMRWLLEHRPDVFEGIRYALNEGGVAETVREEVTYFGVEVGTKQFVSVEVSSPDLRRVQMARTALLPLQSQEDPLRVSPEVAATLEAMAEHRVMSRELLRDVERAIAEGNFWKLHPSYRCLMQNVVRLGGIVEKDGVHVLSFVLENLPDEDPKARIDSVRAMVGSLDVTFRVTQVQGPAPISGWTTPLFGEIEQAARATYGEVAIGPQILQFASNDSRYLRSAGITAYGLWPFPVSLYQTYGIHRADERVTLDWFMQGVEMTRTLVDGFAAGDR